MFAAPASDQALQRWQPSSMCRDVAPSCPRCASPNTKFCYYNNYSLSQPRYFCKGCRRYWTRGGSLRNVPVGGGSRKNRRGKPSSSSSSSTTTVRAAPAELAPSAHPHDSSTTQDCNVDAASQSSAAEIDLAAVYAKFLNSSSDYDRKSSSGSHSQEQENSSFSAADSVTPESRQTTSLEIIGDQGETLIGVPRIEETVEGMLMDNTFVHEAVQDPDGLLLGDATSSFANFPWQPMVHLQEIETFQSDDQFKLLSAYDSWSLFDLSGFEVFTRP